MNHYAVKFPDLFAIEFCPEDQSVILTAVGADDKLSIVVSREQFSSALNQPIFQDGTKPQVTEKLFIQGHIGVEEFERRLENEMHKM
jgi:hypothetical protein